MSYHYSAIPPFWELSDCPSYFINNEDSYYSEMGIFGRRLMTV
jgi:hypothetical protein